MVLAGALVKLATTFIQGRQHKSAAKAKAEANIMLKASDDVAAWERIQAENSANSWKDEFLTVLLSIPLILCFIPGMVGSVEAGFAALETMPDWYQIAISVVIGSSFGVKQIMKLTKTKNHGKETNAKDSSTTTNT
ncbi:MAG: hypothetical protein VW577_07005 [Pelagibacteraceae bacterium]